MEALRHCYPVQPTTGIHTHRVVMTVMRVIIIMPSPTSTPRIVSTKGLRTERFQGLGSGGPLRIRRRWSAAERNLDKPMVDWAAGCWMGGGNRGRVRGWASRGVNATVVSCVHGGQWNAAFSVIPVDGVHIAVFDARPEEDGKTGDEQDDNDGKQGGNQGVGLGDLGRQGGEGDSSGGAIAGGGGGRHTGCQCTRLAVS